MIQILSPLRIVPLAALFFLAACGEKTDLNHFRAFPSLEQVVKELSSGYSLYQENKTVRLVKKKEGYYIEIKSNADYKAPGQTELFWDASSRKYMPLKMLKRGGTADMNAGVASGMLAQKYQYNAVPYFGYQGWYNDVIEALESVPELPDTFMNALARGYSSKASNLLSGNQEETTAFAFDSTFRREDFKDETIQSYTAAAEQSIETYKSLMQKNPEYATLIGPVDTKYANECMNGWLELSQIGRVEDAKKFLRGGLYDPLVISVSKNVLASCPQHAILFTNGDNDTYPLLYVQEFLNFRQDVVVANLSLLNTGRYINYLRNLLPENKRVAFSLPMDAYINARNGFVGIDDGAPLNSAQFLSQIPVKPGLPAATIQCSQLYIPFVTPEGGSSAPAVDFLGRKTQYLLKADIALTDILHSCLGRRPVCFALTVPDHAMRGLSGHQELVGLAQQLVPVNTITPGELWSNKVLHPDSLYETLMHRWDFTGYDAPTRTFDFHRNMKENSASIFLRLAAAADSAKMYDLAKPLMDKYNKVLPVTSHPYPFFGNVFIEFCLHAGLQDYARSATSNYLRSVSAVVNADPSFREAANLALRYKRYLPEVIRICREQSWSDYLEQAEEINIQLQTKFPEQKPSVTHP